MGANQVAKELKTPTILYNSEQAFLVVDCTIICEILPKECAQVYLGAYYVFHCAYPPSLTSLLGFLEKIFTLTPTTKPGLLVDRMYNIIMT